MKLPTLILCLFSVVAPAFADDVKLVERKTCEQIKTEIAALKAVENPDADQQAELKQLNAQQRANCGAKGAGRRAIPRAQPNASSASVVPEIKSDALTEYMNAKKSNCEKLNAEIEKLVPDMDKVEVAQELQRVYDMDCVEHKLPEPVVAENIGPSAPVKTDEEIAAEFDANIAAGLCGDGTKPNRFGCCPGEVFKDLVADGFACCPKNMGVDDICFPPLK